MTEMSSPLKAAPSPKKASPASFNQRKSARDELVYFRMVRVLHGIYNRLQRVLVQAGVTAPQFEVISLLVRMSDAKLKEIGKRLLITGGNVTGIMDRLEKIGLVLRVRDTDDRRIIKAKLTQKGLETFYSADVLYKKELKEVFGALNKQEKRILAGLLRRTELRARRRAASSP